MVCTAKSTEATFFAFLGYITKKDLSKWYYLLFGTLLASIVVSIINIFLGQHNHTIIKKSRHSIAFSTNLKNSKQSTRIMIGHSC